MKNILFVSHYTGLGGGETAALSLADRLTDYNLHLLVPREGAFAEAWRTRGWKVHIHPFRGTSTYFVPSLWAHFPFRHTIERIIQENNIHLIHSDYHALPFALPASKQVGIPCVWMCWGWWFHPKLWQRQFFQQVDVIFAASNIIKQGFLGQPPFMPPDDIQVLYPGVDTQRFSPRNDGSAIRQEVGIDAETPLVLMLARFQNVKGHDTFVEMARIVSRRIPEVHFIVAGENLQSRADSSYQQRILAMAQADQRLWQKLHYLGHRNDVETLLAAADVVVCPSHFESFGMVNVEAMASGRPVISTNQGGPAEVIIDGVTGYLVPPKNPTVMADRVIELLYSPNTRRSFGTAGHLRVQQLFSADAVAEQFINRIEQL